MSRLRIGLGCRLDLLRCRERDGRRDEGNDPNHTL
jgi:hypothetical protein